MDKMDKLLDLIVDIVNDDSRPWGEKKSDLIAKIDLDAAAATALGEFVGWFDGEIAP